MKFNGNIKLRTLLIWFATTVIPITASADDIDIFLGSSGGSASAPKILFLLDNARDWVNDTPAGKSVIDAMSTVLNSVTTPTNIGLAMFTLPGNPTTGAYIRFAPRDMSIAANRTAFTNMTNVISANANLGKETTTNSRKDESAAPLRYLSILLCRYTVVRNQRHL